MSPWALIVETASGTFKLFVCSSWHSRLVPCAWGLRSDANLIDVVVDLVAVEDVVVVAVIVILAAAAAALVSGRDHGFQ